MKKIAPVILITITIFLKTRGHSEFEIYNDCQKLFLTEENKLGDRYEFCEQIMKHLIEHLRSVLQYHYGYDGTTIWCSQATRLPVESSSDIPRKFRTVEEGCGNSTSTFKRIVGGETSQIGAWPWIALLGYDDEIGPPFKCGGSLITSRHVLTAAHCVRPDLICVRLGEHDLSSDINNHHVDIQIKTSVSHPNYDDETGHSDIALLLLERNVEFNSYIYPICLPITDEIRTKSFVGYTPFVAGWGDTEENGNGSTVLNQIQIIIYDNEICIKNYRIENPWMTDEEFDSALICAGLVAGGKDTCEGDSGGPLMLPLPYENEIRFYLIGIVSYGYGCARPDLPGAYTSTQYFLDWIQETIENTH